MINCFRWVAGIFFHLACVQLEWDLDSWGELATGEDSGGSVYTSLPLSFSPPPQLFIHYNILSCSQPITICQEWGDKAWGRAWQKLGIDEESWWIHGLHEKLPLTHSLIHCGLHYLQEGSYKTRKYLIPQGHKLEMEQTHTHACTRVLSLYTSACTNMSKLKKSLHWTMPPQPLRKH